MDESIRTVPAINVATSSTSASWSLVVVVVAYAGSQGRLLGTLAGPVVLDPKHRCWIGGSTVEDIGADLFALAAALALAFQVQFPCQVLIRPDLSLSRWIAQELVTTSPNPALAQLCRVLSAWQQPHFGRVSLCAFSKPSKLSGLPVLINEFSVAVLANPPPSCI